MSVKKKSYIPPDEDEVIKFISEGAYGIVCLVNHEGKELARKEVQYDKTNQNNVDNTIHEIELMLDLNHKHIIKLIDYFIDTHRNRIYIYTKYYETGNLWNIIDEKKEKHEDFTLEVYILVLLLGY